MSIARIKKNDTVIVMSGKSVGKTGKVIEVLADRGRVLVEGVNIVKKHMKKSQDHPKGVIAEKEASLAISNLMLHCPTCKKGVRVRRAVEAGKRVRKCRKCGHQFDA